MTLNVQLLDVVRVVAFNSAVASSRSGTDFLSFLKFTSTKLKCHLICSPGRIDTYEQVIIGLQIKEIKPTMVYAILSFVLKRIQKHVFVSSISSA